jgi:hypothetical protein
VGVSAKSDVTEEAPTESVRVFNWRVRQFLLVGADQEQALVLADSKVDVREFERMVRLGCDAGTAARILL